MNDNILRPCNSEFRAPAIDTIRWIATVLPVSEKCAVVPECNELPKREKLVRGMTDRSAEWKERRRKPG